MTTTEVSAFLKGIQSLSIDLKVETLAIMLQEAGIRLEDIVISPAGLFKRPFNRDIGKIECHEDDVDRNSKVRIEVNREGLYDTLPEALVHPPRKQSSLSIESSIDEIKTHEKSERDSRKFFLPFEQEFYRLKIFLENEEQKSSLQSKDNFRTDYFMDFWGLPKHLFDHEQIGNLIYLLPMASKVAGNLEVSANCFETILRDHVTISRHKSNVQLINVTMPNFGKARLGVDFSFGGEMADALPSLTITIGPLTARKVIDYLPDGKKAKILQILIDHFIPVEYEVSFDYSFVKPENDDTNSEPITTWLGFNVTL